MQRFFCLILLALGSSGGVNATAQSVYRCGNAYSHHPCANGEFITVSSARTPQQQEARRDTAREPQRRQQRPAQAPKLSHKTHPAAHHVQRAPQTGAVRHNKPALAASTPAVRGKKHPHRVTTAAGKPTSSRHRKKDFTARAVVKPQRKNSRTAQMSASQQPHRASHVANKRLNKPRTSA